MIPLKLLHTTKASWKRLMRPLCPYEVSRTNPRHVTLISDAGSVPISGEMRISQTQTNQSLQSIIELQLSDLLGFLEQYRDSCSNLQMICSWNGVPLPYINLVLDNSLAIEGRIELSLRFSEYLIASRTATAKISN